MSRKALEKLRMDLGDVPEEGGWDIYFKRSIAQVLDALLEGPDYEELWYSLEEHIVTVFTYIHGEEGRVAEEVLVKMKALEDQAKAGPERIGDQK
jgi:hypothetical protein